MDTSAYVAILERQHSTARKLLCRKGEEATSKPDRTRLLHDLASIAVSTTVEASSIFHCIIDFTYPPSSASFSELKPLFITDMRLETHHTGRVLIVRTFGTARRLNGVFTLIEDAAGNVDRLGVYNLPLLIEPQEALPREHIFAIKEPYYKATIDGGYIIRVDHPCDILPLDAQHSMVPIEWTSAALTLNVTPQAWKEEGNNHYRAKQYHGALKKYSCGIDACSDEDKLLRADLYRNRAIVQLLLGRFEPAIADAHSSLLENDDRSSEQMVNARNAKALFRAGRAHYELGHFEEARRDFRHALHLAPKDFEASKELERTTRRLDEATSGSHDIRSMWQSSTSGASRLDNASFTRNVTVRMAGHRGRGLFAAKSIKAGDVVLCEKAFGTSSTSDHKGVVCAPIDNSTNSVLLGSQASLLFDMIDKLRFNPGLARKVLELDAGAYRPRLGGKVIEGTTIIDTFEVLTIIERNAFAKSGDSSGIGPSSLWITSSYLNHSCVGNGSRIVIGDMILVTAIRDIAQDDEITIAYSVDDQDPEAFSKLLQAQWGFTCDCPLCVVDLETTPARHRARQALRKTMDELLATHTKPDDALPPQATIQAVRKLYTKLTTTYEGTIYKGFPRLALLAPSVWLNKCFAKPFASREGIQYGLEVFQNFGFEVTVLDESINVLDRHAIRSQDVITAAMHLAKHYSALNQKPLSQAFEDFARNSWQGMYKFLPVGSFEKYYSLA